jgi:hypothetical protein
VLRRLACSMLLLLPLAGQAQQDWIPIAETDETLWHVRPGSLELSRTKGQVPIALVVGRISSRKTQQISLYKWYVSMADCQREMGKLVTLNVDGSYAFENDFVFGSGNVASSMAESICGAWTFQVKAREGKGL